jgi:hypothetical protein
MLVVLLCLQGEGSSSALFVSSARGDAAVSRMLLAAGANAHFLRAVRMVLVQAV